MTNSNVIFFIEFPISGLGEPYMYHDLGVFYKNVGILLGGVVEEGSQFFHEIRLQFLLSLTPFQILILLVSLDVLSYVSGQVYLTL